MFIERFFKNINVCIFHVINTGICLNIYIESKYAVQFQLMLDILVG